MTVEQIDEGQYSLDKNDGQYKAQNFPKSRTIKGNSYGAHYQPDDEEGVTAPVAPAKRRGRPPKAKVGGTPLNVHPVLQHLFGGGVKKESVDMLKTMMLESIQTAEYRDLTEEELAEISVKTVNSYIASAKPQSEFSSTGVPAPGKDRSNGVRLALKKKYGDKNFGFPEPKVKATD